MYLVSALYNEPADRAEFDAHYLNVHKKLAESLPDIAHFTVSWPEVVQPTEAGSCYCVALMYWDSKEKAMAAFSGSAGTEAMNDLPNFAGAGVTVLMAESEAKVAFSIKDGDADEEVFTALELHNAPEDPAVFGLFYREVHSDSLSKLAGLTSLTMNWTEPGPDGNTPPYHVVSALEWSTRPEMMASITSQTLAEAAVDLENYAGVGVSVLGCRSIRVV